jgi:hypothetical protein
MKKFYILFKNTVVIEGTIEQSNQEFEENIIKPLKDQIYSWSIWESKEEHLFNLEEIDKIL